MILSPASHRSRLLAALIAAVCLTLLMSTVAAVPQALAFEPEAFQVDCARFAADPGAINIGAGEQPTAGDDIIIGTPGDDVIAAGAGDDLICGLGGNDTIWGQGGNDVLIGGPGDDKLRGGPDDDVLLGGDGVDDLNGGRGNDIVLAQGGHDKVARGGTGDDYVTGGPGNDVRLSGNGGSDFLAGGDGDEGLISGGPRPDELHGGAGDDLIKGLGGADRIFGDAGNDELRGGEQPDLLDGGGGTDLCNGGLKDDRAMNCETLEIVEALVPDPLLYTSTQVVPCPIAPPPPFTPTVEPTCTVVTVPEDDTDPANGRTIDLMVAYVDNGNPLDGAPVVSLAGGPGGTNLDGAPYWFPQGNGFPYDALLFDQRGVGDSSPSLNCVEYDNAFVAITQAEPAVANAIARSATEACAARLRNQGVNTAMFNTEQNADDLELIRRALGFEPWTLWGISYGSRLALTAARDHPEGVRAIVIDAAFPVEVDAFGSLDANFVDAMNRLIDACAAHVPCATTYGDLGALLDQAVLGLNANPQTVSVLAANGSLIEVYVDGGRFLYDFVFGLMYLTGVIPELPRWIALAAEGDVTEIATLAAPRGEPTNSEFSEGMSDAVMCQDEAVLVPLTAPWRVDRCALFSGDGDATFDKTPATGPVPALVLSGAFDPITPPKWGRQVADSLTNATYAEFTRHGHGAGGTCFEVLFDQFVTNPAQPLNTSCANQGLPNFNTSDRSPFFPSVAQRSATQDLGQVDSWIDRALPPASLRPSMETSEFLAALRAN